MLPHFAYTRESQWQDGECWIYCHLCVIFPFQEEIFHLEPGKVESGKGKCSYDPKLNSVSALISKYHVGLVTWDYRHEYSPAQFLLAAAAAVSSHMDSSSFPSFVLICSSVCLYLACFVKSFLLLASALRGSGQVSLSLCLFPTVSRLA